MKDKVLLVEDSNEVYTMVSQALASVSDLVWAPSLEAAESALNESGPFSLILLDVELPDGNGVNFCSRMQSRKDLTPVFFLTAHGELSEKVLGFSAGAEDYIVKPFSPLELKARVESKLRRLALSKEAAAVMKWPELEIDKDKQEVKILENGSWKHIDLTSLEFKLLVYMATRPRVVISRDDMLNDIWGQDIHVYPRSVDTHVSKLRKKLGSVAHVIESVHGTGYKFSPTSAPVMPNTNRAHGHSQIQPAY